MQYDRELILNILDRVHNSIEQIEKRSENYHSGDDFLMTPTGVTVLDSICMQFIAIGESLKGLDKITSGTLLVTHPEIDWKHIKGLRDIIAHHCALPLLGQRLRRFAGHTGEQLRAAFRRDQLNALAAAEHIGTRMNCPAAEAVGCRTRASF